MNDAPCSLRGRRLAVLFLAGSVSVMAAVATAQSDRPIVLNHADSLEGRVIGGQEAQVLIGHVQLQQGTVHIACDSALQFKASGDVTMMGHVIVTDDTLTMTAPRGVYLRVARRAEGYEGVALDDGHVHLTAREGLYLIEPRIAIFRRDVFVRDSASTITSDSLVYFRNTRRSDAFRHVTVFNQQDNVTIFGGRLEHDAVRQYSRVTQSPLLLQIDTSESGLLDTLFVRSHVMESYRDSVKLLVATDSVSILRSDLAAIGQEVRFFSVGDSILLRKSPVVWYQRTQVTGDSINVYLQARRLRRVLVMGSAVAVSQDDSTRPARLDQLTGERMQMIFANQRLNRIDVDTRAISIYHLYDDSVANGLNRSSGDRIVMRFAEGKITDITIVGGVEGEYFPENMVHHREQEYRVPGFSWRADRPHQQQFRFPFSPGEKTASKTNRL